MAVGRWLVPDRHASALRPLACLPPGQPAAPVLASPIALADISEDTHTHDQEPGHNGPVLLPQLQQGPSSSSSSSGAGRPQQQVTRHNFQQVLPDVRQALADCQFFSFDCEMTGLYPDSSDAAATPHDDYEERYRKLVLSAQQFLVTQFGLSAFCWDAASGSYQARTFNFYLFPRPWQHHDRRFMCQASSLQFLASQVRGHGRGRDGDSLTVVFMQGEDFRDELGVDGETRRGWH